MIIQPTIQKELKKLINENKDAKSDVGNFIWMVIVLKKWLDSKKYIIKKGNGFIPTINCFAYERNS